MARPPAGSELEMISDAERAGTLLRPLRLAILRLAREPISASEIGARLGLPRQRINYHVQELAKAGFLKRAGRRRRRNMVEQQYVAAARNWSLSPELLGGLGADWRRIEDTGTTAYLVALSTQMQADLARTMRSAGGAAAPAPLSLKSQFRFESAARREQFEGALRQAVIDVIARHTAPNLRPDGTPGPGRAYRLVLGLYPYTPEEPAPGTPRGG